MNTTEIVVGTDGSAWSAAAVRWAAREANRRGAALRVVLAYEWNWPGARFGSDAELRKLADQRAEETMARAAAQVREVAPDVAVHRDTALGEPVPVLLAAAKQAELIVLGNRGRGGFGSLMLGSVSQRVATYARCPVVVVRGRRDIAQGVVVVGVDGSTSSLEALELGFQIAAERNASVVAVRTYEPPSPPWGAGVQPVVYEEKERDAEEHAALAEWVAPWREKYPDVAVETLVAHGGAAGVLVGLSHTAQVVAVGSRGHGGLTGTLVGSVGLQLLHHADCPVVITHKQQRG